MSYIIGSLILGYTGFVIYKKVKDVKAGMEATLVPREMWDVYCCGMS